MINPADIHLLVGVIALCVLAVLMCVEGNDRLGALSRRLEAEMRWDDVPKTGAAGFLNRQAREARVFLYGLPSGSGVPDAAREVARQFRRLALLYMIAGWIIWYCLIFLGAVDGMGSVVKILVLSLPPAVLGGMWTLVRPWPEDATSDAGPSAG